MQKPTNLLDEAAKCFNQARQNLILGAKLLYEISEKKLWEGNYDSFGEYVESECQISVSQSSKLIKSWKHFAIEGGFAAKELESIDMEKLYLATSLKGTPREQLEVARVLTRKEMIEQGREEKNGKICQHTPITICSTCHIRLYE